VTESWELPEFWELNDWTYRMEYFFMLRCLIFKSRVERGIPSFKAAPFGPATFPLLSARAASMRLSLLDRKHPVLVVFRNLGEVLPERVSVASHPNISY